MGFEKHDMSSIATSMTDSIDGPATLQKVTAIT